VVDTRVAKVRHTYTTKTTTTTTWTTRIRYGRCSAGARASREYTETRRTVRFTTENSPYQCTPRVRLIREIAIGLYHKVCTVIRDRVASGKGAFATTALFAYRRRSFKSTRRQRPSDCRRRGRRSLKFDPAHQ